MKKLFILISLMAALVAFIGCTTGATYHKAPLPDPKQFHAHFGDMDTNADNVVTHQEFNGYFPQAEPAVFLARLNEPGGVD